MAPNVTLHFFAANDLNGSPLLEITDEDTFFQHFTFKPSFQALGGAELTLNRNVGFALFDDAALQPESFCRYLIHAYSDTDYYGGFFLDKRQQTVIHREGSGAEEFVFGGPGPKYYLDRSVLGIDNQLGGDAHVDLTNGVWRWETTATAGRILNYLLLQDAARTNPALPDLTNTFDPNDDSNGDPWDSDIANIGDYEIPIGESYLQAMWNLEDAGELYTDIALGTVASPKFELNAYNSLGTDVTSNTFASGKVLLREGVNIANDSLTLEGISLKKATHAIVEGKDGHWVVAVKPSFSPGDYIKWAKISHTRSSSDLILERAGLHWLRSQENAEQELVIEILPGFDDAAGLYFPAPDQSLWLGNTITVDTTLGVSHSPIDLNNEAAQVTGFEISLGVAGDDSTAEKQARSWQPIKVHLNEVRGGQNKAPSQRTQEANQTKCCPHSHFPPACDPVPAGSVETEISSSDDDPSLWVGSTTTGGSCWGGVAHEAVGASGGQTSLFTVAAGDLVYARLLFQEETGDDSWENVSNYAYVAYLEFENVGGGVPTLQYTIVNQLYHNMGCISATHQIVQEVPTGYNRARVRFRHKLGGIRYRGWLGTLTATDPIECPPFAIDPTLPSDSPYYLPSDTVEEMITRAIDSAVVGKISQRVTNTSGGVLQIGDVVVPDLTEDDPSVTTTTTAAETDAMVGVVTTAGADGELVTVMWAGKTEQTVNVDGSAAVGDYLYTSTTAGAADVDGTRSAGAVGRVIAEDGSGNTLWVLWWGVPDTTGGGVTDHGALTGLPDDDHPQYVRTTLGGRDVVNTVAASGSTETLDLATANFHDVTLTANCTLTLSGATNGVACYMTILLRQDGTGSRTVTWPGSVTWVGGSAPTLETAAAAWNLVTLVTRDGGTTWFADGGGTSGGGGAPTTADYLVGTAQGGLSAEIVVGTTPGGELGGTWASPTVDSTHSGSAHHTESHQSRHNTGGADALKLDDLAAPDDNTDLNSSTGAHGLLRKLTGSTANFLRADGTWATPSGSGTGNVETGGAAVTIPDLLNDPGVTGVGGGGINEEYDTGSSGLTWGSAPSTENSNSTIPSALFYENTQNAVENLGLRAWAPGASAAFDCRTHVAVATTTDVGAGSVAAGLIVTSTSNTSRAVIQLEHLRTTGSRLSAFTYAAGAYTQRGNNWLPGAPEVYLRITRDASNNVSFWWSVTGYLWTLIATQSFTFTPANIGYRMSTSGNFLFRAQSNFLRTTT